MTLCRCGGSRAAHGFSVTRGSLADCGHCDNCDRFRSAFLWRCGGVAGAVAGVGLFIVLFHFGQGA